MYECTYIMYVLGVLVSVHKGASFINFNHLTLINFLKK